MVTLMTIGMTSAAMQARKTMPLRNSSLQRSHSKLWNSNFEFRGEILMLVGVDERRILPWIHEEQFSSEDLSYEIPLVIPYFKNQHGEHSFRR
jgi:hypothetical protein